MARLKYFILFVSMTVCSCEALKILVSFPVPGKSHSILGDGIVRLLLKAGHEVTYITPFPKQNIHKNLRQIDVSTKEVFESHFNINQYLNQNYEEIVSFLDRISLLMSKLHTKVIQNYNVQDLMKNRTQKFDVIIMEWLYTELAAGFSAVFDSPFIWVRSMDPHWAILRLVDESPHPAFTPTDFSEYLPPFNFWQRVSELWYYIKSAIFRDFKQHNMENDDFKRLFGTILAEKGRVLASYQELKLNASLVLGNSHASLGQAIKLPSNYIPIGGYHIDDNLKPLPKNIKKIMDDANHGVIYFSLGSNLKSKDIPESMKKGLLNIFGGLKETVLWKFEEVLPNAPKNVHTLVWAPQQSVLSHPNCKLFITHGGMLSVTEAVHFGVPMIGIPVFVDQFNNINRAVKKGFAKRVDLSFNMVNELKYAIDDVINNAEYARKAKEWSSVYHDRVVPPGVELVHWVEHVARTRGAAHLRSPALHVPAYQKIYLDLIAVILVILMTAYVLLKIIMTNIKVKIEHNKKD